MTRIAAVGLLLTGLLTADIASAGEPWFLRCEGPKLLGPLTVEVHGFAAAHVSWLDADTVTTAHADYDWIEPNYSLYPDGNIESMTFEKFDHNEPNPVVFDLVVFARHDGTLVGGLDVISTDGKRKPFEGGDLYCSCTNF